MGEQTRVVAVAWAALVMGAISLPLFFLGLPAVIALVLAAAAYMLIQASAGKAGGLGLAQVGAILSLASLLLFVIVMLVLPSLGRARENVGGRSYCPANIRGIVQSMIVYASENSGVFPVVPGPVAGTGYSQFTTVAAGTSADATLANMYAAGSPMRGDVTACLWILVLKQQCTPKQFLCKSDPAASSVASPVNNDGLFHSNFTAPPGGTVANALSYSLAYPWTASGRVGPWWRNTTDASLPLMSDMAPMEGTGSPVRRLGVAGTPRKPAMWNSNNHSGDGQNVGYADAHAGLERTPTVGQNRDNIFTASSTGRPQEFGGTPVTKSFGGCVVPADTPVGNPASPTMEYGGPYDTVMVPMRDCTTNGM